MLDRYVINQYKVHLTLSNILASLWNEYITHRYLGVAKDVLLSVKHIYTLQLKIRQPLYGTHFTLYGIHVRLE